MKHFLLSFIFLFGCMYFSHAQDYWAKVNLPQPGKEVNLVEVNADGLLVMGTTDQIYFSDDEGLSWTPSTNWPGHLPHAIAFNSNSTLFVGSYLNGMFRSYDSGLTFEEINNGLSTMIIYCILVLDDDVLLVGTPTGIFRSVKNA